MHPPPSPGRAEFTILRNMPQKVDITSLLVLSGPWYQFHETGQQIRNYIIKKNSMALRTYSEALTSDAATHSWSVY